jgi:phage major head subunit gpT-like protein
MNMNTGLFPQDLRPGVKKWFGDEYMDYSPIYASIFEVISSDRGYEEDALLSGLSTLQRKDQGGAISYDAGKQGYSPRYDHFTMALGFQITMELMQDGVALKHAERMSKALARSAKQTDEILAHQILNRAFNSSYLMVNGDGKELLSTSHPIRGNGSANTFSNKLAVDADLSEAALEQATIDIGNLVDDRGQKIHLMPKSLIVNVAEQFNAHRILKSTLRVATTDNDANALNDMGIIKDVIVTPYTTDTDAWFLTTSASDGLKFYDRMAATIDNDSDFDTASGKFKVMRRLSIGWSDPRGLYGSSGG